MDSVIRQWHLKKTLQNALANPFRTTAFSRNRKKITCNPTHGCLEIRTRRAFRLIIKAARQPIHTVRVYVYALVYKILKLQIRVERYAPSCSQLNNHECVSGAGEN